MLNELRTFFDHSRHKLTVRGVDADLDILAFHGDEYLSQPFKYQIEFTSSQHDISAEQLLGKDASFSLHPPPQKQLFIFPNTPEIKALRTLFGVVSGFQRLSGSNDEACYAITFEPRLALLDRGKQTRLYQHQSVPEIVDGILRSRHEFEGQDFYFNLLREYPKRPQVMQYEESDLTFISRLLAEVGIWYRFTHDERLKIDVVEFHDDQRRYQFGVTLAYRPQSGLSSSGQDSVWKLQTRHKVVEKHINIRAYHHRDANAYLDADIDQTRGARTTYGEAYHYAEPYTVLGDALDQDEDLLSESGFFYGRLRHERYLNEQTTLSGVSSSATLAPGQVLKIEGGAPQAFAPGAVITWLTTRAARDSSFEASFEAIPYAERVCFRPALLARPKIAGTLPARVTSTRANDPYGHIDMEGRYKVNFLFDRDPWKPGAESMWLRLARPYAGDTHGLHLPLLAGTEVAVAFEQGDPDRPYIAHALHDNRRPDHVSLRNYKRNVLRTPANNKLRLDDTRGQEHIKLSTEHSGKSQLNLGHLVDAERKPRGQGAELRTDGHAAIRAGSGIFISAEKQPKAQGDMLSMAEAVGQLEEALRRVQGLARNAASVGALEADETVPAHLKEALGQLKEAGFLVSAPAGMALVTPEHLQLAAGQTLAATSNNADFSVLKRFTVAAGQAIGLFAQRLGIKLVANQGAVSIQAQNDSLQLLARKGLDISSTEDEIRITAKQKITLNVGSNYITLEAAELELLRRNKPDWVDELAKEKYPQLKNFPRGAFGDIAMGWPDISGSSKQLRLKNGFTTFDRTMSATTVAPGERLYRVVDPGSGDNSICWMREVEFKKLESKSQWRREFAVWKHWNENGEYLIYTVPPGQPLKVWEGRAATQQFEPDLRYKLEGGNMQVVLNPAELSPKFISPRQKTGWGYDDGTGDTLLDPLKPYLGLPELKHNWR